MKDLKLTTFCDSSLPLIAKFNTNNSHLALRSAIDIFVFWPSAEYYLVTIDEESRQSILHLDINRYKKIYANDSYINAYTSSAYGFSTVRNSLFKAIALDGDLKVLKHLWEMEIPFTFVHYNNFNESINYAKYINDNIGITDSASLLNHLQNEYYRYIFASLIISRNFDFKFLIDRMDYVFIVSYKDYDDYKSTLDNKNLSLNPIICCHYADLNLSDKYITNTSLNGDCQIPFSFKNNSAFKRHRALFYQVNKTIKKMLGY